MKRIVLIILFICLAVGMPIVMQVMYENDKTLRNEGITVQATIVSSESNNVEAEYVNDKGETVKAKAIINDGNKNVGRTFEGKYLPDDPEKVTLPAKNSLKWTLYGILLLLTFIGWYGLCRLLRSLYLRNSVGAHGVTARAQVINYDPETKQCTINFQRADGIDCNVTLHSDVAYAMGGYINIRYIPKGKSARVMILGY